MDCPASRPTVRAATGLSKNESSWLDTRREKTLPAMRDFFGHVSIPDFDAAGYLDRVSSNSSNVPNIGIAVSGGGYRAMLNSAGAAKAFDSRTENSTSQGHLGGLLQSATYFSGLSGGGWLLGSIFINNFTSISDLQTYKDGAVWQLGNSILEGPDNGGIQLLSSVGYWDDINDEVSAKSDAGFPTSITDYWYNIIPLIFRFGLKWHFADQFTGAVLCLTSLSMTPKEDQARPGLPSLRPMTFSRVTCHCPSLWQMADTRMNWSLAPMRRCLRSTPGNSVLSIPPFLALSLQNSWDLVSRMENCLTMKPAFVDLTMVALSWVLRPVCSTSSSSISTALRCPAGSRMSSPAFWVTSVKIPMTLRSTHPTHFTNGAARNPRTPSRNN